jgi:hypothetical protein
MPAVRRLTCPWVTVIVCVQLGSAAAQTVEPAASRPSLAGAGRGVSSQVSTSEFLPAEPSYHLTILLEADERRRLVLMTGWRKRHARLPSLHFEPMCVAPCALRLQHGIYSLALRNRYGQVAATKDALFVTF